MDQIIAEEEEEARAALVGTANDSINEDDDEAFPGGGGRWEELHGNHVLPPSGRQPRALLHFLGGALLGAAPQLTYLYLLERLSSRGYLVVATPYQLSFDHLKTCDEIVGRFELVAPGLAKRVELDCDSW